VSENTARPLSECSNPPEGYNSLRRKFGGDSFLVNGPYHAIMSALTPTGAGGAYDLFNFGFGGSKNDNDQGGPWSPDSNLPTPASLLLPQPELLQQQQQQQQQQPFFYSPTPPAGQSVVSAGHCLASNE
jgi:hypothetical protein